MTSEQHHPEHHNQPEVPVHSAHPDHPNQPDIHKKKSGPLPPPDHGGSSGGTSSGGHGGGSGGGHGGGSGSGSGGTTTPPGGSGTPPTPGKGTFHGIINFGNNGSTMATNQYLAGTYLGYPWSLLEPSQGQFAWDVLEKDMAPWIAAGKKIIIRVSPSGWASWGAHPVKSWTPTWVYNLGVKSVTESDGAIKPQYWNPLFEKALSDFVAAFAARYDGNPHIIAVEAGIGDGGETKPDTRKPPVLSAWQAIGYTDQVWFDTIKHTIDLYKSAFTKTPVAIMPSNSFLVGTSGLNEHSVVDYAVSKGCALQHNGITSTTVPDPTWLKAAFIIAEQRNKLANSPGDTLDGDIAAAIKYGASWFMGFEVDLQNNQPTLAKYAALAK